MLLVVKVFEVNELSDVNVLELCDVETEAAA